MCFNVVDNFKQILQNVKFRRHFLASQHFSMVATVHKRTFRSDLLVPSSETRKTSSHGSHSVCMYQHKMTNLAVLICLLSKTWIVLQLWCWLAIKGHNTNRKIYRTKTSIVALLSTVVNSSTWIAHHSYSLIFSNNCASISSGISFILVVMVLAKRGIHANFWTATSPKTSWQISLEHAGSTLQQQ